MFIWNGLSARRWVKIHKEMPFFILFYHFIYNHIGVTTLVMHIFVSNKLLQIRNSPKLIYKQRHLHLPLPSVPIPRWIAKLQTKMLRRKVVPTFTCTKIPERS